MEQQTIKTFIQNNKPWQQVDGMLVAMWSFENFTEISNQLPALCDIITTVDHHPTVTFGYNFIRIETTTHDADNQVTEKDVDLATRISQLLN